ncbi:MAG: alpha-galactosidase [Clostridia bacterium]|nr:alpha-galactosidase [Clostridia bacterium]
MMKVENANQLYAIRGDFAQPVGALTCEGSTYRFTSQEYEIQTVFTPHPSGVTRREDVFFNTSNRPLTLYSAQLRFALEDSAYEIYTQRCEWSQESIGAWQTLHTAVSAQNDDMRFGTGAAPILALWNSQMSRGTVYHLLCDGMWQIKAARRFIVDTHSNEVVVQAGFSNEGFRYTIAPGESLSLAPVLYYSFENRLDLDAYKLHRYCNDIYPQKDVPVIYNTWMFHFGSLDYDDMLIQLEKATELGVEYFVLDGGWFGRAINTQSGGPHPFGSWLESTKQGLQGKMMTLFGLVREKGLRPGLWFEIEGAATSNETYLANPELYFVEKERAFVNFADARAVDHIFSILSARIRQYNIELIKFDYNIVPDIDMNSDAFLSYFRGYRDFLRRLRQEHPEVHLECCAGGGLRMVLGNVPYFDSFWMSDNHSLAAQLDIYKNTLIRMPSRALEHWITVEGIPSFRQVYSGEVPDILYSSGNAVWTAIESLREDFLIHASLGGPLGFSCDLSAIPPSYFDSLKRAVANYKREKEFWRCSECRILADDEKMLVLQFSDASLERVKIIAFSRCKHQKTVTVLPVLAPEVDYLTENEDLLKADSLKEKGITLSLDGVGSCACVQLFHR